MVRDGGLSSPGEMMSPRGGCEPMRDYNHLSSTLHLSTCVYTCTHDIFAPDDCCSLGSKLKMSSAQNSHLSSSPYQSIPHFSHVCCLPTHVGPCCVLLVIAFRGLPTHSFKNCNSQALSPSRRLTQRVFFASAGVTIRNSSVRSRLPTKNFSHPPHVQFGSIL